jgi:hypothetical protein
MNAKKQIDAFRQLLVKTGRNVADYAIIITSEQQSDLMQQKGVDFKYCDNLYVHTRAKDMVIIPVAHLTDEMEMTWRKRT